VTQGLLSQANDEELRGVLAHEIAHEDLGHPAKAQLVGAGVGIGVALLEQFFPGSSALAPLAGSLITNNYTRPMELEADRHAVTLLERAGYSKQTMIDTLSWLARHNGDSGGGFLIQPSGNIRTDPSAPCAALIPETAFLTSLDPRFALPRAGNFSSLRPILLGFNRRILSNCLISSAIYSGTAVAIASGMKKVDREHQGDEHEAPNYVAILALLGEMARRVNENISKVDLKPLQDSLIVRNPSN
jgi:hypothetical protein